MNTTPARVSTRRDFIRLTSMGLLAAGLSGCCDIAPCVATPLFYGFKFFTYGDGAPVPMRVFFPSKDGSPQNASFYQGCGEYPLIIFIHGNGTSYRSWVDLPAMLARAGFIVVVPDINPGLPDQVTTDCEKVIGFMYLSSEFSSYFLPSIGVCGHSYGGAAALRVAIDIGAHAFAGLSGDYFGWPGFSAGIPFSKLNCPALVTYGAAEKSDSPEAATFDLSIPVEKKLWDQINRPKHLLTIDRGHHFDYVPPGSLDFSPGNIGRGPCLSTPAITTDFVVTFFAKYMRPVGLGIPDSLIPPPVSLTSKQAFYDGGFLTAFRNFQPGQTRDPNSPCWFTQHWETNDPLHPIGDISLG